MTEKLRQADRVSYSEGRKLNVGNYESVDFHVSYSTDVGPTESSVSAMTRARKFVQKHLSRQVKAQK